MRAELRGLSRARAEQVAAHIWAAGQLIDEDPQLAFEHAETARQLAPRLPIVREAAAETAYAAGEFAVALREYRAIRRMSGGDELIPVIADCERALGRPRDALEVLAGLDSKQAPLTLQIEALIVEAGVRADLGQRQEGLRLLKSALGRNAGPNQARARMWYAYADLLLAEGDEAGAREAFVEAAELDRDGLLDTADRVAELDGVTLPESFADEEPEDEPAAEEEQVAEDKAPADDEFDDEEIDVEGIEDDEAIADVESAEEPIVQDEEVADSVQEPLWGLEPDTNSATGTTEEGDRA
ncbi:hypothetical protein [Tessaracoccus oleiagri]|uniref:hypothetical protein n=1 Tax=Tessaracoccus oleiagri TaxID=686624 RepID=UPI0015A4DE42|nr:hypothetical protein [Tessaracoccus oleiagri]